MPVNVERVRRRLKEFDFPGLLVEELGWNCYAATPLVVQVDGFEYVLKAAAEKCGMVVFTCSPAKNGETPPYPIRRKIEQQVRKSAHEHLIIFVDGKETAQTWQWVKREAGAHAACREHVYRRGQTAQVLVEKLQSLAFELEEEERLTITDVTARACAALDVEKVTKKFYDRFKKEHQTFLAFIEGIDERTDRDWYASLMLNRMMFVYFIQKRGFLDGDPDYLRNRLQMVRERRGKGKFLSFYRYFLLRLFHEGLGKPAKDRARDLDPLLGKVPYLNGGLFDVHELEREYGEIDIPDEAFEGIFDFFDAYTWHLDERPLRADNEINPDVLGYIFEKYINQKQMGAYYTKEDITGYITRNTVVPYLFDAARKECAVAFKAKGGVWRLLCDDPDRYIYPAVRSGVVDAEGEVIPESVLPEFVREGMCDPKKRMFDTRYNLTQATVPGPDGENLALPMETWREYVERRTRCLELRATLANGEVQDIGDFITLNLDIERFAEDVIVNSEGPELVRAFWKALTGISILDPTCGSGAFLFAALNILEPLYNACIDGMQGFLDDLEHSERKHSAKKLSDFREVLAEMGKHPNRRYFVLKTIVLNNLYGVDLMDEAVEICKLRLFLKLVAQVERVDQIEPLPDIDFNIRAGNTLVGFTSLDAVREVMTYESDGQHRMLYPEEEATLKRIEEEAELADRAFHVFHEMQTKHDMDAAEFAEAKTEVRRRLDRLREELNHYLAKEYGVRINKSGQLTKWCTAYKPFHWFVEFHGIMHDVGFCSIVGNPPYVQLSALKGYRARGFETETTGNLYSLVLERSLQISPAKGRLGFIVPVSSVSTDGYYPLQQLLAHRPMHYSSYDDRPSRLFDGLEHVRLTIHVLGPAHDDGQLFSTNYRKWQRLERETLFAGTSYVRATRGLVPRTLPKLCSEAELSIMCKLEQQATRLFQHLTPHGPQVFYSRKVGYFLQVLDFQPEVRDGEGNLRPPSEFKQLFFRDETHAGAVLCCLNSSLFYWFITVFSDCRHVNKREVEAFPVDLPTMVGSGAGERLKTLARKLMKELQIGAETRNMRFAHDRLTVQCIIPRKSKEVLDEIDRELAQHYGFTDDELDFIVNYDIKYRMGMSNTGDIETDENGTAEDEA